MERGRPAGPPSLEKAGVPPPPEAAATSNSSSRCLCDGQYLLAGSGTRWHGVPLRVFAWQQTGLPSKVTPTRSWLSTYSVASFTWRSTTRYTRSWSVITKKWRTSVKSVRTGRAK
jgi:hypothetical protein